MKNKIDKIAIITTAVCLMPMILAALLYDKIPEQMPIHFDINGVANGYAPKFFGAFGIPILMAAVNLFLHYITNNDPKTAKMSSKLLAITKWTIAVLSIVCSTITIFMAIGIDMKIEIFVPSLVGLLMVIIGNYLPKTSQNNIIGIKLPWTLKSEENWNKTHHFAGFVWVVLGLIMILCGFFKLEIIFMLSLFAMIIIPCVYSYYLYKKGI
ncbi:MAG: SdpI family protein [Oscillospiraceae bacterium]